METIHGHTLAKCVFYELMPRHMFSIKVENKYATGKLDMSENTLKCAPSADVVCGFPWC